MMCFDIEPYNQTTGANRSLLVEKQKSTAVHMSLLHLIRCVLALQRITVELLCGSAPLGPHLDVCRLGHH